MPLYEYKCQSCGEIFEVIQKFVDTPLTVHEKCGGALERLVSSSALHFKGTGWYVTDYAGKSNGKDKHSKEAKKDGSSTSGSDSSSKTESKPAGGSSSEKSSTSEKSSSSDKKV